MSFLKIHHKFISSFALFSLFSFPCFGANFTVTNNSDSGFGSFRQAITDLNNSTDSSNTISFNSTYTITLGSSLPVIQKPVSITGNNSTIAGDLFARAFVFNAGATDAIQVASLIIYQARSLGGEGGGALSGGGGGGGGAGLGGGVCSIQGQITLDNVSFASNVALGGDGGNGLSAGPFQAGGGGGTVSNASGTNGGAGYVGALTSPGGSSTVGSGGSGFGGGGGGGLSGLFAPNGGIGGGGGGGGAAGGAGGGSLLGGGGGGSGEGYAGTGGFGGGNGGTAGLGGTGGGGGGAGLGGGIFIHATNTVTLRDPIFSANVVVGGQGGQSDGPATDGGGGSGHGQDIFMAAGSTVIFDLSSPLTISTSIESNPGSGGGVQKTGSGILTLSGANTWIGTTTFTGGVFSVGADNNLGASATTLVFSGGTLQSTATFTSNRAATLSSTGAIDVTSGNTLTMSGIFSGGGLLTKQNTGTLILTGTNTYTGGTILTQGILSVSADNHLGNIAGGLTFTGGTLQSTGTFTSSRAVSLTSSGTIDVTGSNTLTINGVINGTGSLAKVDSGTLVLGAANTYSGPTTINGGSLRAGAVNALSPNSSISLTNTSGATLDLNNFSNIIGGLSGGGATGGNVLLGSGNLTIKNSSNSTYAGIISGSGSLHKPSSRLLYLTGANTYTGGTILTQGTLSVSADNHLGNIAGGLTFTGGTLQSTGTFTSSRAVSLTSSGTIDVTSSNTLTMSGIFSGSGSLTKQNTGTLILTGANTYSGGTTVSAGVLQGTTTSLQGAITNNASVVFDQTTTGTYSGTMSGSGTLIKQNTGAVTLSGANTYSGGTILTQGILSVGADNNLGAAASGLIFNGGILQSAATFTSNRVATLNSTGTIDVTSGNTLTMSGIFSGSGSLTKQNTGTLILTGANTYTGGTTVSAGTLQGNTTSLQGNIIDNATLVFDQTTPGTYSGILSGSGTLTKQGSAAITFSNNSSIFTGTTLINAGIFFINGQLGGTCTVSSGGTLGGNGIIGSVANSGVVSPGTSIGTLTINGNYTQNPTGTLLIEITPEGATDLLQVTGTATLDGTLEVSPEPGVYAQGTTYTILTALTLSGQFSNTFSNMPLIYSVEYHPHQVILITGASVIIPPNVSLCGNAQAISNYMFCPPFGFSNADLISILEPLINSLPFISLEDYQRTLIKFTPSQLGALPLTELENNYSLANTFFVEGIGQRSYCYVDTDEPTSIWVNPLGFVYSQNDQHNEGSCSFQKSFGFTNHTYGVAGGVDHLFNDNWTAGAGVGYSHSKLNWKHNAGKAQANTAYLGSYVKYDSEYFYFDLLLLGAGNFYDLERQIAFPGFERKAHSDFTSWNLSELLLAGVRLEPYNRFFIQPEVVLDQLNVFQERFKEGGANSLNLDIESQYSAFFRSLVNAKFVKEWYVSNLCYTPSINVGWLKTIPLTGGHYTAKFKTGTFCQPDFTVSSFHKTIDQLLLGAQLLLSQEDFQFSLGYEGKFGGGSTIHALNIAMRWRF